MVKPQQPELRRSDLGSTSQDGSEIRAGDKATSASNEALGPVPADNQPGHHPEHEQDKPEPPIRAHDEG